MCVLFWLALAAAVARGDFRGTRGSFVAEALLRFVGDMLVDVGPWSGAAGGGLDSGGPVGGSEVATNGGGRLVPNCFVGKEGRGPIGA